MLALLGVEVGDWDGRDSEGSGVQGDREGRIRSKGGPLTPRVPLPRHKNLAAHCSPAFRVEVGDSVTVGQCRPLSKTVRYVHLHPVQSVPVF